MHDAIISLKPKHVENILSGNKTVELRTRTINMPVGSKLWIYATLPVGKIKLSVDIDFVEAGSPLDIWERYGKDIFISRHEFDKYTKGRQRVVAIGLRNIEPLDRDICLTTMRKYKADFQPPQFFSRLCPGMELYSAFYV